MDHGAAGVKAGSSISLGPTQQDLHHVEPVRLELKQPAADALLQPSDELEEEVLRLHLEAWRWSFRLVLEVHFFGAQCNPIECGGLQNYKQKKVILGIIPKSVTPPPFGTCPFSPKNRFKGRVTISNEFSERFQRGGGQRPFGTFPKNHRLGIVTLPLGQIHTFWEI